MPFTKVAWICTRRSTDARARRAAYDLRVSRRASPDLPPGPRRLASRLRASRLLVPLLLFPLVACDCSADLSGLGGALAGVVCEGESGGPLGETTVRLEHAGGNNSVRSDERGAFRFARVPAGDAVVIIDPDGEAREHAVFLEGGSATQFLDPACREAPGLDGVGDIIGQICNRHVGDVVREALLTVTLPSGEVIVSATDDNGRINIEDVPAGEHILTAQAAGYQRSWLVPVVEGQTYDLAVGGGCSTPSITAGWVGGRLCDPNGGGPLTGAQVTTVDSAGNSHSDITDVDGGFLLGPAAAGPVTLRVQRGADVDFQMSGNVYGGQESTVLSDGECFSETCSSVLITATEEDVSLFLVVDRSGSMSQPAMGYPGSRWSGVKSAIQSLTTNLEDEVEFGLLLYPERMSADQCGAGEVAVSPTLGGASMIQSALDSAAWEPEGGTPTASSIAVARGFLADRVSDRRMAVVIATDGGPNCNGALSGNTCTCSTTDDYCRQGGTEGALNCLDNVEVTDQVSALYDELDIPTYVIGIPGSENFGWVLDDMATAGHTALAGDTGYYDATDVAALESALEEIGRRVAGCRLEVDENLYEASGVQLFLNDQEYSRDPMRQNGFDVVSQNEIELFGATCDAWLFTNVAARIATCTIDG